MKYGEIIRPDDVPALLKSGMLRFGMELEFSNGYGWYVNCFTGFIVGKFKPFCADSGNTFYRQARFPLPALKDGDPIVVGNLKLHFRKYGEKGVICYCEGLSSWSNRYKNDYTSEYCHSIVRLPTEEELHDAGLGGWYDGRIDIN